MSTIVTVRVHWTGDTLALVRYEQGPDLRLERQPGESDLDFRLRVQTAADGLRDAQKGNKR